MCVLELMQSKCPMFELLHPALEHRSVTHVLYYSRKHVVFNLRPISLDLAKSCVGEKDINLFRASANGC